MKTFVAIVKCQHCGCAVPAVLNRISKLGINRMDLKNDCQKCDKSLNELNEQGGAWEVIKAPRGYMGEKKENENG